MSNIGDELAYSRDDDENAEFIAHAREDVPKLLAEVERQRVLLSFIKECFDQREGGHLPWAKTIEDKIKEIL